MEREKNTRTGEGQRNAQHGTVRMINDEPSKVNTEHRGFVREAHKTGELIFVIQGEQALTKPQHAIHRSSRNESAL